jgi:hypothetical protein
MEPRSGFPKIPGTRTQRIAVAVVVTIVTLMIIDAVVFAMTPLGCGPANVLHVKASSSCRTVASLSSPTPTSSLSTPTTITGPSPRATANQSASPSAAASAPAAATPPPAPAPPGAVSPFDSPTSLGPFLGPTSINPFGCGVSCAGASGGLALSCRLPIFDHLPGSGGFVILPSGTFQPDPRSAVVVPNANPAAGAAVPPAAMQWFGLTYDRGYSKWLPVPYAWVTPDGTQYAYPGAPDGIYVVNVRDGSQVELGAGQTWAVLDVEAVGVYATTGSPGAASSTQSGLWLLPFSGAIKQITTTGYWQAVTKGAAYGTAVSAVPFGTANTILKLDLSSGTTSEWFTQPGAQSSVTGFDVKGNPVIVASSQQWLSIWISISPNRGFLISNYYTASSYQQGFTPNGPPLGDSHGLWFSSYQGIALYANDGNWYWMNSYGGTLAGECA